MLRPVRAERQVLLAELDSLLPILRFLQVSFGTCQKSHPLRATLNKSKPALFLAAASLGKCD
jgi:hypothetical protein